MRATMRGMETEPVDLTQAAEALREWEGETVDVLVVDGENERDWQGQLGPVVIVEANLSTTREEAKKEIGTVSLQVGIRTIEIKPSDFTRAEIRSGRVTFHLRSGRVTVARPEAGQAEPG